MSSSCLSENTDNVQARYRLKERDESHIMTPAELRLYRSYSWMMRARELFDLCHEESDETFILYWIAFNALYAEDSQEAQEATERGNFNAYFAKLLKLDTNGAINQALWMGFQDEIRYFLQNPFVFEPFWKHHNGVEGYRNWERWFDVKKQEALNAIVEMNTQVALETLFDRLYVLRNQILHGAATYRSSVNRDQIKDGTKILATLIPIFFDIMQANLENQDWGKAYYPRVR